MLTKLRGKISERVLRLFRSVCSTIESIYLRGKRDRERGGMYRDSSPFEYKKLKIRFEPPG